MHILLALAKKYITDLLIYSDLLNPKYSSALSRSLA